MQGTGCHMVRKRKALSGSRRFGKLWNLKIRTVFSKQGRNLQYFHWKKEISKDWNFKRLSFWTDRGDPGKLKKDGFITSMGCNNYLWISW